MNKNKSRYIDNENLLYTLIIENWYIILNHLVIDLRK